MTQRQRHRHLVTTATVLAALGFTLDAHASGHTLDGVGLYVDIFFVVPTVIAWIVAVGTLFGRSSGSKFTWGLIASLGATWGSLVLLLVAESPMLGVAKVACALLLIAHFVRLGVHLVRRVPPDKGALSEPLAQVVALPATDRPAAAGG